MTNETRPPVRSSGFALGFARDLPKEARERIEVALLQLLNRLGPTSRVDYERAWRFWTQWCQVEVEGGVLAAKQSDALKYVGFMRDHRKWAPRTQSVRIGMLATIYDALVAAELVAKNPVRGVRIKHGKRPLRAPYVSEAEMLRMLKAPLSEMERLVLLLGFGTGIRRVSMVRLKVGDVERADGKLRLRVHGKGDKRRTIPLPRAVAEALERWVAHLTKTVGAASKDYLLTARLTSDQPISRSYLLKVVKKAARHAGVPPDRATLHAMRRTFATLAYQKAKEPERELPIISAALMHSSVEQTRAYIKVPMGELREATVGESVLEGLER